MRGVVRRWSVFSTVGLMGIAVQLAVLTVATRCGGWHYLVGTGLAVEAAVFHNFLWHEHWTWSDRVRGVGGTGLRFLRFNLTNGGVSLVGNLVLMRLFAGVLAVDAVIANALCIAACAILNFAAAERLVFRVNDKEARS